MSFVFTVVLDGETVRTGIRQRGNEDEHCDQLKLGM